MPKVTIYILNFNYGRYISQAIKSVLSQTYDNLESRFWWLSMRKDVNTIVGSCVLCQFTKHGVSVRAPLLIRELQSNQLNYNQSNQSIIKSI